MIRDLRAQNQKIPFQILNMLLKSYHYVENLEIPQSGPELPPPALSFLSPTLSYYPMQSDFELSLIFFFIFVLFCLCCLFLFKFYFFLDVLGLDILSRRWFAVSQTWRDH